jgi:hypothetical protein
VLLLTSHSTQVHLVISVAYSDHQKEASVHALLYRDPQLALLGSGKLSHPFTVEDRAAIQRADLRHLKRRKHSLSNVSNREHQAREFTV